MKFKSCPGAATVTVMDNDLLSEILSVEREIRSRIADIQGEAATRLDSLKREIETGSARECGRLQAEVSRAVETAECSAREEAAVLLAEANAYAERIAALRDDELDGIIIRHLEQLRPVEGHDRQDEQT